MCGIPLGETETGETIEVRIGRYGPFLSNGELRTGLPDMQPPDEMSVEAAVKLLEESTKEPETLGSDPLGSSPPANSAGHSAGSRQPPTGHPRDQPVSRF